MKVPEEASNERYPCCTMKMENPWTVDNDKFEDGHTNTISSQRSIILGELEDELERQLEEKAKRNELSVANVKSILRAVLHHEDVHQYVDYTLEKTDKQPEFQMKLTRAKAKELIDKIPQIAPLLCLTLPQKVTSEIDVLINQDLSEDSSDEEYQPHEETIDDDDETVPDDAPRSSVGSPFSPFIEAQEDPHRTVELTEQESIGQRTRSKLSLSKTPLEAIEQAFIPPDITTDMYDTECDNQDWLNFLKDLVQPLDTTVDGVETNDDENDPEYNIMGDEEFEALDNEELRVDRAVKISKKEVNDLMAELFEYTRMHEDGMNSDDENNLPIESNKSIEKIITEQPLTQCLLVDPLFSGSSVSETVSCSVNAALEIPLVPIDTTDELKNNTDSTETKLLMDGSQYLLLKQQILQHTQMLLQTYLLSIGNPFVDPSVPHSSLKLLAYIKEQGENSGLAVNCFASPTLQSSFDLMESYTKFVQANEDSVREWNVECSSKQKFKRTRLANRPEIHPHLMELCLLSNSFPYPLYLPNMGFGPSDTATRSSFLKSEDILITHGLDFCKYDLGMDIVGVKGLEEACNLIYETLLPTKSVASLVKHIMMKRKSSTTNIIQYYYAVKQPPGTDHYVVPITGPVPQLYKQDARLLPYSWHRAKYSMQQKLGNSNV